MVSQEQAIESGGQPNLRGNPLALPRPEWRRNCYILAKAYFYVDLAASSLSIAYTLPCVGE